MSATLGWFQIATSDPDRTQRFYADLFGWNFAPHPGSVAAGNDYRVIQTPDDTAPMGGLAAIAGDQPPHMVASFLVEDVDAVCTKIADLGGKVEAQQKSVPGVPAFANLLDLDGNRFQVFTPPA
jgi:predicted enzyme related to lactoylglutathione lyase